MHIFVGIATAVGCHLIILFGVHAKQPPKLDLDKGEFVLEYSRFLQGVSLWSAMLVPVILLVIVIVNPSGKPLSIWAIFGCVAVVSIMLILIYLEVRHRQLRLSEAGMYMHSLWHRDRFIAWNHVANVRRSKWDENWFIVDSIDGQRIRVCSWMIGILDFIEAVKSNVPSDRWSRAQSGFQKIIDRK